MNRATSPAESSEAAGGPGPHAGLESGGALPEPAGRRRRSPGLASGLSLVPGLGQLYNLQLGKALFFLPAALLPTVVLAVAFSRVAGNLGPALLNRGDGALFPFVALFGVLIFLSLFILGLTFWASAVVDARRTAEELSEGRQASGRWWLLRL